MKRGKHCIYFLVISGCGWLLLAMATAGMAQSNIPDFFVPPPPFSENIFPCSECHADMEADPNRRELEEHTEIAEQIRGGKESAVGFLVGQAMRKTQGKANPKKIGEMIKKALS